MYFPRLFPPQIPSLRSSSNRQWLKKNGPHQPGELCSQLLNPRSGEVIIEILQISTKLLPQHLCSLPCPTLSDLHSEHSILQISTKQLPRTLRSLPRPTLSPLGVVTFLADQGLAFRTTKSYVSGVCYLQISKGLPDPFKPLLMTKLEYALRGIKRSQAKIHPHFPTASASNNPSHP